MPHDSLESRKHKHLIILLFMIYLAVLSWTVLWKLEAPWAGTPEARVLKLVPFVASGSDGANSPAEIAVNIALFVPFGIYLRQLLPTWPWYGLLAIVTGTSITFETIQFVLAIGVADVADVLGNALGGLLGIGIHAFIRRQLRERADTFVRRFSVAGTAVSLPAVAIFIVAVPLHFGGPPPATDPGHYSQLLPMSCTALDHCEESAGQR